MRFVQRSIFAVVALLVVIVFAAPGALGQLAVAAKSNSIPNNEFGVWGGASFNNPTLIGTTPSGRQLSVVGLRYSRTIWEPRNLSLRYTLDVIPVEVLGQPTYINCAPSGGSPIYCQTGRETVYGGGVNPIGLKLNFRRRSQWQPFGASTAGFAAFVHKVPYDIPVGTQFNFTFDFQGGVQHFNSSRTRAWSIGYKYQHISNANRSSYNPGVDFNVIYIGYTFFR